MQVSAAPCSLSRSLGRTLPCLFPVLSLFTNKIRFRGLQEYEFNPIYSLITPDLWCMLLCKMFGILRRVFWEVMTGDQVTEYKQPHVVGKCGLWKQIAWVRILHLPLVTTWSWENPSTSFSLTFHIYKMGIARVFSS